MIGSDKTYPLCRRDAIPENSARGFTVETPAGTRQLLLARRNKRVFAYINRCPHTGVWVADRFLDRSGTHLQCATHGALFRVHDGFCIHGPCAGKSLQPVTIDEQNGELFAIL
ncbi:MAG: Rieske 2Fe-2S domain-containing protein [Gammaproteobacteria bacterium]